MRYAAAVALALLAGCASEFDTPPAFESERYLCEPGFSSEWQAAVDQCSGAAGCGGVASLTGTLEGQPVTVESMLAKTTFTDELRAGSEVLRDRIQITGDAPYFQFSFDFKEIGGSIDDGLARELAFGTNPDDSADPLGDAFVTASMRLSNNYQSVDLHGRTGAMSIESQTETELTATFYGGFGTGDDYVEGCLHLFATDRQLKDKTGGAP